VTCHTRKDYGSSVRFYNRRQIEAATTVVAGSGRTHFKATDRDWLLTYENWYGHGIRVAFPPEDDLVPEAKAVKNRVHLDVRADDPVTELQRLVGLGARVMAKQDGCVVLVDPEGNEFCMVR
jgi:hypothetical protein